MSLSYLHTGSHSGLPSLLLPASPPRQSTQPHPQQLSSLHPFFFELQFSVLFWRGPWMSQGGLGLSWIVRSELDLVFISRHLPSSGGHVLFQILLRDVWPQAHLPRSDQNSVNVSKEGSKRKEACLVTFFRVSSRTRRFSDMNTVSISCCRRYFLKR